MSSIFFFVISPKIFNVDFNVDFNGVFNVDFIHSIFKYTSETGLDLALNIYFLNDYFKKQSIIIFVLKSRNFQRMKLRFLYL